MQIRNHRLYLDGGKRADFRKANSFGGAITPRYLVMHYTAGGSGRATADYFSAKTTKTSAHFVIDRDGTVIQQLDCNLKAHHAGRSAWKDIVGLNSHSIGIELANWGLLMKGPQGYKSYTGVMIPDQDVVLARHRNGGGTSGWEVFPDRQFSAAISVAAAIVDRYAIPEDNILGHDDIAPRRKVDPGPAFNMEQFRAKIFGRSQDEDEEAETWLVRSSTGLNLRDGPSASAAIRALLKDGAPVAVIEKPGKWWFVAGRAGAEDVSGFVHSHWLVRA